MQPVFAMLRASLMHDMHHEQTDVDAVDRAVRPVSCTADIGMQQSCTVADYVALSRTC